MFKYLPHTEQDIKEMLEVIGVDNIDDLFSEIPKELLGIDLDLPKSHSELEIYNRFNELAAKNKEEIVVKPRGDAGPGGPPVQQ